MSKEDIKDLFKQIGDRFGNDVLKGTHLSSIVKDIQPSIHPAYFNILKELERKQLVKTVSELDKTATETVFELIKLRSDFKENNGFDNKAYDVFDAVCEIFDFQVDLGESTVDNLIVSTSVSSLQSLKFTSHSNASNTRKGISIGGKMTSYDMFLLSDSTKNALNFLNRYNVKKTNTWRIPTAKELKEVYQDLIIYNNDFKELWCLDENSGTLSVFDALSGVHQKCNTKEQLNQNRPLLAVCDVDYSSILDKELSINLNTSNEWGISIVYGCLGEQEYPDGFVKTLNHLQLYKKSTWRLPSILELEQLYKQKEVLNIHPELSVWSSTEPKKFFVNVLDFNSGEIKERKKTSSLNRITGSVILVSDE
jgi:hypothetical protein